MVTVIFGECAGYRDRDAVLSNLLFRLWMFSEARKPIITFDYTFHYELFPKRNPSGTRWGITLPAVDYCGGASVVRIRNHNGIRNQVSPNVCTPYLVLITTLSRRRHYLVHYVALWT